MNILYFLFFYGDLIARAPVFDSKRALVAVLYTVFTSGLMIMIKFIRDQLASKEREKAQLKLRYESELKFLRNQTNPHFLMNTLNNIYALARKKSEHTAEVVMRLSELLRVMLYDLDGHLILLTNEVKLIENYLELEMIRYDNRLSLTFEKSIDTNFYKITPFLLLPFVENAFKHGVSETRVESFINIALTAKKGRLFFTVENTSDSIQHNDKKNIGLVNVRRQLELTYTEHHLDVKQDGNIFFIELQVNLNSHVEI